MLKINRTKFSLQSSNRLKSLEVNIFSKASFQQTESWRTAELVKRKASTQYTNNGRQYDFTSWTATGSKTLQHLAVMLLHAA